MKTPLRTLACTLAVASVAAAAPASANLGLQRVTGGPGASATLKNGVLTMHWAAAPGVPAGSARIQVPPDYLLPQVTAQGQLGGLSFDGQTAVLAYARQGEGGRSHFLVAEKGKLAPLSFRGTVTFDAVAPAGEAIYLTRRASATDATKYKVLSYDRSSHTLNPVVTKIVFSVAGGENPSGWTMQGQPLTRTSAADGSWTYTLYNSREYPFIHALPLGQGAWAACIELPAAWRGRAGSLRLRSVSPRTLQVLSAKGDVVATADLRNWKLAVAPAATS
ncbi:MAG TPA: hypothetical protein VFD90_20595 [Gaiellales bacterium]|jgi:hypothetical protein|nr:hypothetical protein [Gaiellales bacterium]